MKKLYGVYDIKYNEQCIGIFDNLQQVVDFIGLKNRNILSHAINKKNIIKTRYRVIRIMEDDISA